MQISCTTSLQHLLASIYRRLFSTFYFVITQYRDPMRLQNPIPEINAFPFLLPGGHVFESSSSSSKLKWKIASFDRDIKQIYSQCEITPRDVISS